MHAFVLAVSLTTPQRASIDSIVRFVMGDQRVLGLSLAVVRDGRISYAHGYGFADRRRTIRVTPETVFPIASLEKSLVAASILRLVERHEISLDDRASKYVPLYPAARGVTIRELLTHTSGIPDYAQLPGFDRRQRVPVSPQELVQRVAALPLRFAPGTDWNYSNTDYVLLGMVIERVTHVPLEAWLRRDLFVPLHLTATAAWNPILPEPQRAEGSVAAGSPSLAFGAANLESDVLDLGHWIDDLLGGRVVDRASLARMLEPSTIGSATVPYGMGFFAGRIGGRPGAWHSGYIEGYSSFIAVVPGRHLGVVLLCNADRVDLGPLAQSVLDDALHS